MWTALMPASRMNSSPLRWPGVPLPVDTKVSSPGLALASAMSSWIVLAGRSLATSRTAPVVPRIATGARLRDLVEHDAGHDVGDAGGRERHHDADRLGRIIERRRKAARSEEKRRCEKRADDGRRLREHD